MTDGLTYRSDSDISRPVVFSCCTDGTVFPPTSSTPLRGNEASTGLRAAVPVK